MRGTTWALFALLLGLSGEASGQSLSKGWPSSTPREVGLDPNVLMSP